MTCCVCGAPAQLMDSDKGYCCKDFYVHTVIGRELATRKAERIELGPRLVTTP